MKFRSPARNLLLFALLALPVILNAQTTPPPPIPLSPMPFIDGLRPTSTAPGALDFTMTIDGANFLPGAVVEFDGLILTPISVLRNRIVLSVPAAAVASAHTATVKIRNSSFNPLQIAASNPAYFPITNQTAGLVWTENAIPASLTGITGAAGIAVGDFNGDGHLDVAVSGCNSGLACGQIAILLGDGHGGFSPASSSPFSSGFERIKNLEVGDFNDDGNLDVVAEAFTSSGEGIVVFFGDGTGGFTPGPFFPVAIQEQFCENNEFDRFGVGDINGDGLLDVVIPDQTNSNIILLLGNGRGGFSQSNAVAPGIYGPHPCSVTLGDFNGDGWLDVAMGASASPSTLPKFNLLFAYNDGTGGFSPTNTFIGNLDGGPAFGLAAGDLNGDGLLDLVAVSADNKPPLTVFTNQGVGTFLNTLETGLNPIDGYSEVDLGDLTGAGALDVVISGDIVGGTGSASLDVLSGDGKGNLFANTPLKNSGGAIALRLGDFSEDGRLDIAETGANPPGDTFILWLQAPGAPLWAVLSFQSGQVLVHASGQLQMDVLSNSADVPLSISSITSGPDFPISLAASTCPVSGGSLDPGNTCVVAFSFQPLSSGTKSETLTITDNANGVPGSVQTVALSGTAIELDAFVQPPIKADGSSVFNAKRGVVPVKFTLMQDGVPTCQLPPATIAVTRTAGGVIGSIDESVFEQAADNGANFRIDTTNCQYIYNLGAGSLGPGTYLVQIITGGVAVGSATFGLQ